MPRARTPKTPRAPAAKPPSKAASKALATARSKPEAILAAALGLFAEQGFHGVSVPEVAAKAKVGAGTIYRYFESKEALVNALYQRHKQALGEALLLDFPLDAPPRAQFHELWTRAITFAQREPEVVNFLELHHHGGYLDEKSLALGQHFEALALSFFSRAAAVGVIKTLPPGVLMALVWGAFTGFMKAVWEQRVTLDEASLAAAEQCLWEAIRV